MPWTVPNPADYACFTADPGHFCLLARIETSSSPPYGMAFPEGPSVGLNTKNNNNIVWKNLTVVDNIPGLQAGTRKEGLIVRNVETNKPALTKFHFVLTNKRSQDSFFRYGTIDVNLGPELFAKWDQGGRAGKGFELVGTNTLRLFASDATIENIKLDPDEWHVVSFEFGLINRPTLRTPALFDLDVTQSTIEATNESTIGGQVFAINLNRIPLLPFGSKWKYLDIGIDPGKAWRELNYDDGNWRSGPGKLGFGVGDEATIIDGGPATNRFITTYFRQTFTVDVASNIDYLTFQLKRDDGAVVYLNGAEVFRNNMPTGAIDFHATALASAVDNGTAIMSTTLPASSTQLRDGENVVAVEIHQDSPLSDDLGFDLALQANIPPEPPEVAITSPTTGGTTNNPPLTIKAAAFDTDGTIALVEFFANLTKLGETTTPPYSLVSPNLPPGTYYISAKATDNLGMTTVSAPVVVVVPRPALSISLGNGIVTIRWTGPGILQETSSLSPPSSWADVPNNPSSPFTTLVGATQKFLRLRQ